LQLRFTVGSGTSCNNQAARGLWKREFGILHTKIKKPVIKVSSKLLKIYGVKPLFYISVDPISLFFTL
jgi:hypothetical protein